MNLAVEANFDGLVGSTHNYGGLSFGNLASSRNAGEESHPREAALQGLAKMKWLSDSGLVQGVLPPHERPFMPMIRAAGFGGSEEEAMAACWREDPGLAKACFSASAMWAANAATISPSADTADGRVHFTPANLSTMLHRSIEGEQTARSLRSAFPDPARFMVHDPLPMHAEFADEGAANHVRLCADHGQPGVELFVHGRDHETKALREFPARQTLRSQMAMIRRHDLARKEVVLASQSDVAINAGAFHNDVVCVGAKNTLFFHELAFDQTDQVKADIQEAAKGRFDPVFVEVSEQDVPIADAITSYLFNSMLIAWPGEDRLVLLAPIECDETPSVARYCEHLAAGNGPIGRVNFVDVRQSMRNGGGPACLRLRVVLTEAEIAATNPKMLINDQSYQSLKQWVETHYREELAPSDLTDPMLWHESRTALEELTGILGLGSDFYPFQRA